MSAEATVRRGEVASAAGGIAGQVWIPYAIAMGAQLPLLGLYFFDLWKRPHYQYFPVAILLTAALIWNRWPRNVANPWFSSTFSSLLLLLGIAFGLAGILFVEPWFAAASVMSLLGSLLARTEDAETGRSLFPCVLPLVTCLYPPGGWDMRLIGWLQSLSASFTSRLLDLIGFVHYMPGTVIQAPGGKQFGIAEACSGVVSFYSLLFTAVALCVWLRRPWFRATLLVLSAFFWAVFMNTVRIMLIPLADRAFEWDLSSGFAHTALGYTTLLAGILLLLSTDQYIYFLFGPVEEFGDEGDGLGRRITRFWNSVFSGMTGQSRRRSRRREAISPLGRGMIWAAAIVLGAGGLFNLSDTWRSYSARGDLVVRFFDTDVLHPLKEADLPAELDSWKLDGGGFESVDHGHGSDLGKHSDIWRYTGPRFRAIASFDQAFPGWHELTTCYRNQGWELIPPRVVRDPENSELQVDGRVWYYVQADFRKPTGERGFLVFSLFDAFGQPLDPPGEGSGQSLLVRILNRMNHRIRASLFQGEAYQTQVWIQTYGMIDDAAKDEAVRQFLTLREQMRTQFLKKRAADASAAK